MLFADRLIAYKCVVKGLRMAGIWFWKRGERNCFQAISDILNNSEGPSVRIQMQSPWLWKYVQITHIFNTRFNKSHSFSRNFLFSRIRSSPVFSTVQSVSFWLYLCDLYLAIGWDRGMEFSQPLLYFCESKDFAYKIFISIALFVFYIQGEVEFCSFRAPLVSYLPTYQNY